MDILRLQRLWLEVGKMPLEERLINIMDKAEAVI